MNICVYGASSTTTEHSFIEAGEKLGEEMAKRNHTLVFGGGANGMMGASARGMHRMGGKIIGVAPEFFHVDGVLYEHCTEFIYPEDMRARKKKMEELSDAFIVTPGGIGTFDEFFEILTLKQLSRHNKPIAILNTNGYYDCMEKFIQNVIDNHFMNEESKKLYFISESPTDVLDYVENYMPTYTPLSIYKDVNMN